MSLIPSIANPSHKCDHLDKQSNPKTAKEFFSKYHYDASNFSSEIQKTIFIIVSSSRLEEIDIQNLNFSLVFNNYLETYLKLNSKKNNSKSSIKRLAFQGTVHFIRIGKANSGLHKVKKSEDSRNRQDIATGLNHVPTSNPENRNQNVSAYFKEEINRLEQLLNRMFNKFNNDLQNNHNLIRIMLTKIAISLETKFIRKVECFAKDRAARQAKASVTCVQHFRKCLEYELFMENMEDNHLREYYNSICVTYARHIVNRPDLDSCPACYDRKSHLVLMNKSLRGNSKISLKDGIPSKLDDWSRIVTRLGEGSFSKGIDRVTSNANVNDYFLQLFQNEINDQDTKYDYIDGTECLPFKLWHTCGKGFNEYYDYVQLVVKYIMEDNADDKSGSKFSGEQYDAIKMAMLTNKPTGDNEKILDYETLNNVLKTTLNKNYKNIKNPFQSKTFNKIVNIRNKEVVLNISSIASVSRVQCKHYTCIPSNNNFKGKPETYSSLKQPLDIISNDGLLVKLKNKNSYTHKLNAYDLRSHLPCIRSNLDFMQFPLVMKLPRDLKSTSSGSDKLIKYHNEHKKEEEHEFRNFKMEYLKIKKIWSVNFNSLVYKNIALRFYKEIHNMDTYFAKNNVNVIIVINRNSEQKSKRSLANDHQNNSNIQKS